jgi:branched-chain amino acid transport system permease protein
VGLVAAAVLAGGVGALVALPALRLRGLYLALATMAFATPWTTCFFPWSAAFGFDGSVHIPRPRFRAHVSSDKAFDIFLAVVFALLSIGLLALRRGPFGRVLIAMKDSEAACATLGLSLTMTKLVVFTLSAAIAGMAGALFGGASRWPAARPTSRCSSACWSWPRWPSAGAATCSGALVGGMVLGFLPQSLEDIYIGTAGVTAGRLPRGHPAADLPSPGPSRGGPERPSPGQSGRWRQAGAALAQLLPGGASV